MLEGFRIALLVSGSIAAYKAAELVREFVKVGAVVRVAMTKAATEFITPLTLETLSGSPVMASMFLPRGQGVIDHIDLADWADVVVLAPATADVIAKFSCAMAEDIVTCTLLATKAPIVVAPAMNVNMWENSVTQENVSCLMARGVKLVGPDVGDLACGWTGAGRMADHGEILAAVRALVANGPLAGCHVIVTAGPTEEPIDPIRFVSNGSTGKMGYALARAARLSGATVTLISGPTELKPPAGVRCRQVRTAQEMRDEVFAVLDGSIESSNVGNKEAPRITAVLMAAAVSDHRPSEFSPRKLKADKGTSYQVTMVPNPDILRELGERREREVKFAGGNLRLIGFAAETESGEQLVRAAREKLRAKHCDLVVGNAAESAFGLDTNQVIIVDAAGGVEEVTVAEKDIIARRIIERVCALG